MMIINIHGMNSDGKNSTYEVLKELYPDTMIYSPTFNYQNENPINIVSNLKCILTINANKDKENLIIGTSLGGFFAFCLYAENVNVKTLLINPSLCPFLTLQKYDIPNWLIKKYLFIFNMYALDEDFFGNNLNIVLGKHDNVINHDLLTVPLIPKEFKNIKYYPKMEHRLTKTEKNMVISSCFK